MGISIEMSQTSAVLRVAGDDRPGSTPERIASEITKKLLRREYAVGQRLIEADLTEELGVGRSTVREALKILASRGVVEIIPYRGAQIRGLTLQDAVQLLDVLEVLTGLAARLAAVKIDEPGCRARLLAAAQPLIEPTDDAALEKLLDHRAHFYQVMLDIAANEDLNRAMPTWRAHLFRTQFYRLNTRPDLRAMVNEYRLIVEAVTSGDGARAEQHARRHIRNTAERMLPYLR